MEKQPKTKKRLWVILAIFITAIIAVWCIFIYVFIIKPVQNSWSKAVNSATEEGYNYDKEEKRKQEALTYLEERYGEEFEIESYRGMSYAYDYIKMYAYPKGYSDEAHQFQIQGRRNEEGEMEYTDSYVMVKLTDEYEAYIDPIIGEYFDEYKFYVRFNSEWLTNNLPPDTKLEDLWELHANEDYPLPDMYVYIYNADKDRNNLENMVKELSVNNIRCSGSVVYYYDYERYTTLTDNWNDNITTSDFDNIVAYLIYGDNNYKFYE